MYYLNYCLEMTLKIYGGAYKNIFLKFCLRPYKTKFSTLSVYNNNGGVKMEQTVYIDILFLINFSMDFLCFYISSRIMSLKLDTLRACIAAAVGGIYAVGALFLPSGGILTLGADIAVCVGMSAIAFGKKNGIVFSSIVYFAVSMALGGSMTAIFNLLNRMGFSGAVIEESEKDGPAVWLLALLAAVSAVITLLGGRFLKKSASVRFVELSFSYRNKETSLRAFVDTGNRLCDPISGKACIVVDASQLKGKLPDKLLSAALDKNVSRMAMLEDDIVKDTRLIPAYGATGKGMLLALRPERVCVDTGKKRYEVDAMIALGDIGRRRSDEKALVPSELIR